MTQNYYRSLNELTWHQAQELQLQLHKGPFKEFLNKLPAKEWDGMTPITPTTSWDASMRTLAVCLGEHDREHRIDMLNHFISGFAAACKYDNEQE
jgi:hypothetical protein